jgi:predicted metalloprotease with PDZ domain
MKPKPLAVPVTLPVALLVMLAALPLSAQSRQAPRSAPISDVRYQVTFNPALGAERSVAVVMTFTASGRDPVLLSLPVWTPGDYEVSNYARNVSKFSATSRGKPLRWDKSDPDTWRIVTENGGPVSVEFRFRADSLDNAATWARPDFLLFNGTNLFFYPQGRSLDFPATVTLQTESAWHVTTGMNETGVRTWSAASYHELVDHPFFVGNFDVDSAKVAGVWMRFSSYPAGSVKPAQRTRLLDQMARAIPTEVAVFADRPWSHYDIMQIADSAFGGMSALEHENSNVGVIGAEYVDEDFVPSVYAHEIFHSWNVKRLRPADMWPYHYDSMQPTPWLWVSEGITDYYADLALVRGGVINAAGFLADVERKMAHTDSVGPVALTDASLETWLHMTDGTQDIYYDKGSIAGLALDIMIRDATDNAESLDHVMRTLYTADYKNGRGFTSDDWWNAVSRAAKGANLKEFNAAYVDGREPYPWTAWLAKAGWRVRADTLHEPRLGVSLQADSAGLLVVIVAEGSMADRAGIKPGDLITSIAGISVTNVAWENWRQKYANQEGAPISIGVTRDGKPMTISANVQLVARVVRTVENDPAATDKAKRVRDGILKGS